MTAQFASPESSSSKQCKPRLLLVPVAHFVCSAYSLAAMSNQSLEDLLRTVASPVDLLRHSQIGPYAFPVVRAEFTNWRDEQLSWRESCALFDQSHHMTDLYIEGRDA